MAMSKPQLSGLGRKLKQQHEVLLEQARDALENSANQQYVELIDRRVREIRDIAATTERIGDGSIGTCIDCADGALITTTDTHLARDSAQAAHKACGGELEFHYNKKDNLLRAIWSR